MDISRLAKEQEEYIIRCRRWLHQHPELGCEEVETTRFIASELTAMGIPVKTYDDITGLVATIEGGFPGKTVMLRADIDALPITETQGKPYCSLNPGVMHACGHDAHTAMLIGAAKVLWQLREQLHGNVKLIFQMGEEIARFSEEYVKRGALEGVDAIFGMHIWANLPAGKANFAPGERMACSDRYTIRVKGKLSHGSAPHLGNDAIVAASAIVMALQTIASRQKDPLNALVVTTGMMNGGTKQNILADDVELVGTVRAFNREFRNSMPERIEKIARATAEAYGCTAECTYYFGPSPLINEDDHLTAIAQGAAKKMLGDDCLAFLEKMTGAEDFSVYTEHIPAVFGFLGFRNEEKCLLGPHHHPDFDVDEDVLASGAGIYAQFAADYLNG